MLDSHVYLSTAPDCVTPSPVAAPGTPASATYSAPVPSNAMPRGFLRPVKTVVKVGPVAAALALVSINDPASASAPASNVRRDICIQALLKQKGTRHAAVGRHPLQRAFVPQRS